jgi:hypothetical protein
LASGRLPSRNPGRMLKRFGVLVPDQIHTILLVVAGILALWIPRLPLLAKVPFGRPFHRRCPMWWKRHPDHKHALDIGNGCVSLFSYQSRHNRITTVSHLSLWDLLGGPRTFVYLGRDEFGSLFSLSTNPSSNQWLEPGDQTPH